MELLRMGGSSGLHFMLIVFGCAVVFEQASTCRCVPPYPTVCSSHFGIQATITGKTGNVSARGTIQYNVLVDKVIRDQLSTIRQGDAIVFSTDSHSCAYPNLLVGQTYIFGGAEPASGSVTTPSPSSCPNGMTYNECGSGCGPETCMSSPRNSTACAAVCVPGCFCDGGLVKTVAGGDQCIRREDCPVGTSTTSTTPSCPAGMTYNGCGSGCGPATCARLNQMVCPSVCVPGCYCDGGLVKETTGGSRCIRQEECPGQVATYSIYKCSSVVVYADANGEFPEESERCSSAHASTVSLALLEFIVSIVMSWNL